MKPIAPSLEPQKIPSCLDPSKHVRSCELNKDTDLTKPGIGDIEVVEYQGKWYRLMVTSGTTHELDQYRMVLEIFQTQGLNWFVVPDYVSEKNKLQVAGIFVEIPEKTTTEMIGDYRKALEGLHLSPRASVIEQK